MKRRNKILAVLATAMLVWIATPIPEGTIIIALLSGVTGYTIFPDWHFSVLTSIVGCVVGSVVIWKFQLFKKVKLWANKVKKIET